MNWDSAGGFGPVTPVNTDNPSRPNPSLRWFLGLDRRYAYHTPRPTS